MMRELHEQSHELQTFKLDRSLFHKSVSCMICSESLSNKNQIPIASNIGSYIAALASNHPSLSERSTENDT